MIACAALGTVNPLAPRCTGKRAPVTRSPLVNSLSCNLARLAEEEAMVTVHAAGDPDRLLRHTVDGVAHIVGGTLANEDDVVEVADSDVVVHHGEPTGTLLLRCTDIQNVAHVVA